MGKIGVHEFITVDGVIESPTWTAEYGFDPRMGETIAGPGAPFFNETPKYVVTSVLESAAWNNSTILGPYNPEAVQELKDGIGGDIYVSGSAKLVRAMLADGLIDELHLFVYPLTLGAGQRLFGDDNPGTKLALRAAETYDNQVAHLAYGPAE